MVSVYGVLETRVRSGVLIIAGPPIHIFRSCKKFFCGWEILSVIFAPCTALKYVITHEDLKRAVMGQKLDW